MSSGLVWSGLPLRPGQAAPRPPPAWTRRYTHADEYSSPFAEAGGRGSSGRATTGSSQLATGAGHLGNSLTPRRQPASFALFVSRALCAFVLPHPLQASRKKGKQEGRGGGEKPSQAKPSQNSLLSKCFADLSLFPSTWHASSLSASKRGRWLGTLFSSRYSSFLFRAHIPLFLIFCLVRSG